MHNDKISEPELKKKKKVLYLTRQPFKLQPRRRHCTTGNRMEELIMKHCSESEHPKQCLGEVFSPAGLVAYAEGAVVSRTIVENRGGTVTLFAFASGEGLSEHTAPFDALVNVLDGEVKITIGGKPHQLKSGESILMPANVPHALAAVTAFKMMLVMIKA